MYVRLNLNVWHSFFRLKIAVSNVIFPILKRTNDKLIFMDYVKMSSTHTHNKIGSIHHLYMTSILTYKIPSHFTSSTDFKDLTTASPSYSF